jgi:hypothetical protein
LVMFSMVQDFGAFHVLSTLSTFTILT